MNSSSSCTRRVYLPDGLATVSLLLSSASAYVWDAGGLLCSTCCQCLNIQASPRRIDGWPSNSRSSALRYLHHFAPASPVGLYRPKALPAYSSAWAQYMMIIMKYRWD